ncbi:HNH endonuclease [Mycobacterium simiae]|uniref:HNH endonuclease n=1 Tax=Mycobacterium simiae TaxID=1784 RepID=A0A5B1BP78_MYCSI|nr:HNH endonuclease [Mycobacterium simiae]KAA1248799.1 HNH endonuclease [Mycobacterium simiae]
MTLRPCIVCGEVTAKSRCEDHRPKRPAKDLPRDHPHMNPARWKAASASARRRQPWCLDCGAVEDLTVDHVISIDEDPSLAYEPLNFAVRCRPCNSRRGATGCTDDERMAILDAITARETRGGTPRQKGLRRGGKAQGALHTRGGYAC